MSGGNNVWQDCINKCFGKNSLANWCTIELLCNNYIAACVCDVFYYNDVSAYYSCIILLTTTYSNSIARTIKNIQLFSLEHVFTLSHVWVFLSVKVS